MERETTGTELLLSEPEIVAWLGLDDGRDDVDRLVCRLGETPAPAPRLELAA